MSMNSLIRRFFDWALTLCRELRPYIRDAKISPVELKVSALYLGIFSFFYLLLSLCVITNRWKFRVSMGDGGHEPMRGIMRAHGNFAEYVPFVMLLVVVLEFADIQPNYLHTIACLLLFGRLAHVYGLLTVEGPSLGRAAGMVLTFLAMAIAGFLLLSHFFS